VPLGDEREDAGDEGGSMEVITGAMLEADGIEQTAADNEGADNGGDDNKVNGGDRELPGMPPDAVDVAALDLVTGAEGRPSEVP